MYSAHRAVTAKRWTVRGALRGGFPMEGSRGVEIARLYIYIYMLGVSTKLEGAPFFGVVDREKHHHSGRPPEKALPCVVAVLTLISFQSNSSDLPRGDASAALTCSRTPYCQVIHDWVGNKYLCGNYPACLAVSIGSTLQEERVYLSLI